MKTFIYMMMMTSLLCLSSTESKAIHKELDFYVTDTDGCRWHVTGWVEYGLDGIRDYDVTVSSTCGTHRFKGQYFAPGGGTNHTNVTMTLHDPYTDDEIPLETIDYMSIYEGMAEQVESY